MLSLLLRAVPAALLHTSDQLLSKCSHFCSPVSHLDLTLWAFAQASRYLALLRIALQAPKYFVVMGAC